MAQNKTGGVVVMLRQPFKLSMLMSGCAEEMRS
jgi:hypothetical protein